MQPSLFKTYRDSIKIKDHVKSRHVVVGDYSYYAGYYDGKSFDDCVMYLDTYDDCWESSQLDRLIIGRFCSIATGARFMMGGSQGHNYRWITNYALDSFDDGFKGYLQAQPKAQVLKGDTTVGNDVWIGVDALIMPGVKIGDGAVIAARSVVTKSVGPFEIWGGNPARFIKKRFSSDAIEKLQKIQWWNWDEAKIKRYLPLLRSEDVDAFWDKVASCNDF